jgi:hypothetical protein
MSKTIMLAAAALGLGLLAAPASAAPVGNLGGIETNTSAAEKAHYGRRCWRHRGHVHCSRGYHRRYYYGGPRYYRRHYGYAPGFFFHFGPRRHYWW